MTRVKQAMKFGVQTALQMRGENVVYRSGEQFLSLRAAPGTAQRPIDVQHGGLAFSSTERSWLCWGEDLRLSGAPHLPQHGDLITDEKGQAWEVQPNERSQCFDREACDLAIRIHTKRVVA